MNDVPPSLFLKNSGLFLQVRFHWADTGEWLHMLPWDVLQDLNGTISRSRLSVDVLADLNSTNLADDSVTMEKLAPQVRADLNKTASRPFGATLTNPYGILGTPIVYTSTNYTVPGGKTLVITSCYNDIKVGGKSIKDANSAAAIIPTGTTVQNPSSNFGWSGYLLDPTQFE